MSIDSKKITVKRARKAIMTHREREDAAAAKAKRKTDLTESILSHRIKTLEEMHVKLAETHAAQQASHEALMATGDLLLKHNKTLSDHNDDLQKTIDTLDLTLTETERQKTHWEVEATALKQICVDMIHRSNKAAPGVDLLPKKKRSRKDQDDENEKTKRKRACEKDLRREANCLGVGGMSFMPS